MSSISSVSAYNTASLYSTSTQRQRPDASKMVDDLFSKLDTSNQGYLQASDFEAAYAQISGTSSSSSTDSTSTSTSSSADEVFKALDTDGDGKVTKQEMSDVLKKLSSELDSQFDQMRMSGGMQGAGGMPPPPPPSDSTSSDQGYTKDELTAKASEIASTDSIGSEMFSTLAANFDKADSNQDGKVSFTESQAYLQSQEGTSSSTSNSSSSSNATSSTSSSTTAASSDAQILKQIMELMRAYNTNYGANTSTSSLLSTLSVSA